MLTPDALQRVSVDGVKPVAGNDERRSEGNEEDVLRIDQRSIFREVKAPQQHVLSCKKIWIIFRDRGRSTIVTDTNTLTMKQPWNLNSHIPASLEKHVRIDLFARFYVFWVPKPSIKEVARFFITRLYYHTHKSITRQAFWYKLGCLTINSPLHKQSVFLKQLLWAQLFHQI